MEKNIYPSLEGIEILTKQALAAVEAAEEGGSKPSGMCIGTCSLNMVKGLKDETEDGTEIRDEELE